MLLVLVPTVSPIAAAQSAHTDAPETVEAVAAETTNVDGAVAQDAAAQKRPQRAQGGIFSSIIEFFRGGTPESLAEQENPRPLETESERKTEVNGAQEPDPAQESSPTTGPEEERVPNQERIEEREPGSDSSQGQAPPAARAAEPGEMTADHVYQATVDLLAEIAILRDAQGIADDPPQPEAQESETPLGAYIKSQEVMEKTSRVQRRLGMIPVEVAPIPVKGIVAPDVYRNVLANMEEIRRVKRQLVVRQEIRSVPLAEGATTPLVYRNLEYASALLDGLVGRPTTSNDVYMYVLRVQDEMALIAVHLGVVLEGEPPAVSGNKGPKEVAEQVLRAVYKTIHLQSRLGMDASSVPSVELEDVTSADVYDATNTLLAELMRIKVHMDVQSLPAERRHSQKKQSSDTFAQLLFVLEALERITKAVRDSG